MADREMSREEAIKRLEEGAPFSELYDSRWECALALAIKALNAEPVVRCKDCKYWSNNECIYCYFEDNPNGYCAWGERKEDAKTN